ncbi:hypothetical protein FOA52_006640 [Chlamydomonas sp. UWO 241]|nr:hypothetical protein FOA52_006640 [Chlamydomonas sp. UWO 241]
MQILEELTPSINTYPSYINFLFQIVWFALVASARLLSTCLFDWRKAGEACLPPPDSAPNKDKNKKNKKKELIVARHGSVSMFPEMATLLVSCVISTGKSQIGGFGNDVHEDDDHDVEEEKAELPAADLRAMKAREEAIKKKAIKTQLLAACNKNTRGLDRTELRDLMKKLHKVTELKLLGFLPVFRFAWPKPDDPEGDDKLERFLVCIMRAYGRRTERAPEDRASAGEPSERLDELEGRMSDASKCSRSASRLMSKRSPSMIQAGWSGNQEGRQEVEETDVEEQALPRRG